MTRTEVLHFLGSCIQYVASKNNIDVSKIRWHLEADRKFLVVDETQVFKSFRHRDVIDIVECCQDKLDILKHTKSCSSAVDE
jgi:hypothetical protein